VVARRSLLVGVAAILLALIATLGTYHLFNSNLGPNGGPPPYPPRPFPSWTPPERGGSRAPTTTASPDDLAGGALSGSWMRSVAQATTSLHDPPPDSCRGEC
jgi:hypothetical protein